MSKASTFEVHRVAAGRSLKRVGKSGLTTLVAGGIVNPFGPTLTALVLDGDIRSGNPVPILVITLNPFAQEVQEVGVARMGDTWSPIEDLSPFFSLPLGGCPTLLLRSRLHEADDAIALYSRFLATFREGIRVLKSVRRFPGNPWDRVQQDVAGMATLSGKEASDRLRAGRLADERRLTQAEAAELAANLLAPENVKQEMKAFLFAWN